MKIVILTRAVLIYLMIVFEKIYLIPFANVKMSIISEVAVSTDKLAILFKRFFVGTLFYGIIYLLTLIF